MGQRRRPPSRREIASERLLARGSAAARCLGAPAKARGGGGGGGEPNFVRAREQRLPRGIRAVINERAHAIEAPFPPLSFRRRSLCAPSVQYRWPAVALLFSFFLSSFIFLDRGARTRGHARASAFRSRNSLCLAQRRDTPVARAYAHAASGVRAGCFSFLLFVFFGRQDARLERRSIFATLIFQGEFLLFP